jgi:large subunit ribosomal protein L5
MFRWLKDSVFFMRKDLKGLYKENVVPRLLQDFGYKSIEEVPKLLKISINRGLGKDLRASKELDLSVKELSLISGQQPILTKARNSIAGFGIRKGMILGTSVTIRREKMYAFLERLIHIVLPRVRDFKGLSPDGFNGGNYNLGLRDQLCFPEISYDDISKLNGFDICISTTAKSKEEAYALLVGLGMPLTAFDQK